MMNKNSKFVIFARPNSGYDPDRELVAKHKLVVGKTYEVKRIVEHGWHTEVYLKDFPGVDFNSVHFDDASEYTLNENI